MSQQFASSDYPFTECEKHGRQLAAVVCPHIEKPEDVVYRESTRSDANFAVYACSEHCSNYSTMKIRCRKCLAEAGIYER